MMILRFLTSCTGPIGVLAILGGAWLIAGYLTRSSRPK